jgi:hypothetical protein
MPDTCHNWKDLMTPSEPTNPEARAYLEGFDDHAGIVDPPTEHSPEEIVIHDTGGRRLIVNAKSALVFVSGYSPSAGTVIELDRDNANALSDALQWAARTVDR